MGALFVPLTAERFFKDKVHQYQTETTPKGAPRHKDKIEPLQSVAFGTIESLWTEGGILDALRRSPLVGADLDLARSHETGRKLDL